MSTKPDITLARWADLVGSFVTDAPSGLRDTGFLDGTPADADIVNAELKQLYLWAKWLDDGDVSFVTLGVDDSLVVVGDVHIGGTVSVTGILTTNSDVQHRSGVTTGLMALDARSPTGFSTGNTNNWDPPELDYIGSGGGGTFGARAAIILRVSGTGSPVLTGIAGGVSGRIITLVNVGSVSIQLAHNSVSSLSGNRFQFAGAATLTVAQDECITLWYDTTAASGLGAWRLLNKNF